MSSARPHVEVQLRPTARWKRAQTLLMMPEVAACSLHTEGLPSHANPATLPGSRAATVSSSVRGAPAELGIDSHLCVCVWPLLSSHVSSGSRLRIINPQILPKQAYHFFRCLSPIRRACCHFTSSAIAPYAVSSGYAPPHPHPIPRLANLIHSDASSPSSQLLPLGAATAALLRLQLPSRHALPTTLHARSPKRLAAHIDLLLPLALCRHRYRTAALHVPGYRHQRPRLQVRSRPSL